MRTSSACYRKRFCSNFLQMTDQPRSIITRPATPDDERFLLQVYKSSRGDDLRGLDWDEDRISEFLEMQYEAQRRFFEGDYQNASDEVVLVDSKPAGRLIVERRER